MKTQEEIENIVEKAEEELFSIFRRYDKIRDYNQEKVLDAFIKNNSKVENENNQVQELHNHVKKILDEFN